MSVNYSSSSPYPCLHSRNAEYILIAFLVTKMLLLVPLYIHVFYLGYQRWRQQHSFATTSHSDIFTFHMAAMELIYVFEWIAFICGKYTDLPELLKVGTYGVSIGRLGQMGFHILTCMERYLAVVHPIVYLGWRHSGGDKIQKISIGFVWLLCFGLSVVAVLYKPEIPFMSSLVFSIIVISFCSISVLCVLKRPRPGEVGGEQVDQVKRRAFHIITAIMGALLFCFAGSLAFNALYYSSLRNHSDGCVLKSFGHWVGLPSSLVLPLLSLHGAGKLPCCHRSNV